MTSRSKVHPDSPLICDLSWYVIKLVPGHTVHRHNCPGTADTPYHDARKTKHLSRYQSSAIPRRAHYSTIVIVYESVMPSQSRMYDAWSHFVEALYTTVYIICEPSDEVKKRKGPQGWYDHVSSPFSPFISIFEVMSASLSSVGLSWESGRAFHLRYTPSTTSDTKSAVNSKSPESPTNSSLK